jgi:hypothetical protein
MGKGHGGYKRQGEVKVKGHRQSQTHRQGRAPLRKKAKVTSEERKGRL